MKSFTTAVALASIVPAVMSLTVNTPTSCTQCQPQLISWSGGAPPYYLTVLPGGQASAIPLKTFDTQNGETITWKVDQKGGTSITLSVKDSTGAVAYTDMVTVLPGPDSSCLNGGSQPAAASPSPQDASVDTAVNTASTSASGPSSMSSVVMQTGTIRPSSVVSGATATRAASVASMPSASSAPTLSVSRATTSARTTATSSSGAQSSLSGQGYGFVGAVGLIGALFL